MHNGQGEMSYMDREKAALYSEQGVWVSWKVPVPRHWDPKTGRIRQENPGRNLGQTWYHWNQLADENPPTGKAKEGVHRIEAPDPYREYLRNEQRRPYNPAVDDDLFFLSAGISPEHGTSLGVGVIKAERPKIPNSYVQAIQRQRTTVRPDFAPAPGQGQSNQFEGQADENQVPAVEEEEDHHENVEQLDKPLVSEHSDGDHAKEIPVDTAVTNEETANPGKEAIELDIAPSPQPVVDNEPVPTHNSKIITFE